MLWMLLLLLVAVVLAGVVVAYVAYPHRGEAMPVAPWVGDAMRRGVAALPTLDNAREAPREPGDDPGHQAGVREPAGR